MPAVVTISQVEFYRRFLMGQPKWKPQDFGINMKRKELIDMFIDELRSVYHGQWTVDELVTHPQDAMRFCTDFRMKNGFMGLPDNIILKTLMNERKAIKGPKQSRPKE